MAETKKLDTHSEHAAAHAPSPKPLMPKATPKLIVVHHKLAVPVNIWQSENDYSFEFEHGGEVIKGDHFESVAKALEGAAVAVKKAMG